LFKDRYIEQAAQLDAHYLVEAIDLINRHCLSYKSSEHQRLVIELCLLQLASLEEGLSKKKSLI